MSKRVFYRVWHAKDREMGYRQPTQMVHKYPEDSTVKREAQNKGHATMSCDDVIRRVRYGNRTTANW